MPKLGEVGFALTETARCADGEFRQAHIRSYFDGREHRIHPDTFYSAPAYVLVDRKKVMGFVVQEDHQWLFYADRDGENAALIRASQ